jgi:multidrug resistance efflux pump
LANLRSFSGQVVASKLAEAEQAGFRASQASAKVDLFEYFVRESKITAPVSGTIVTGDLRDRISSAVSLGDPLFHIAQLDNMVAVAKVSDSDIGLVKVGASGQIATKAYPGVKWPLKVERIVPLAQAEEGKNAFEVHAVLDIGVGELLAKGIRPGSEGLAKFDTGNRTLMQIGSRRIIDALRLWLWW